MENKLILTFVTLITLIVSVLIVASLGSFSQQPRGIGVNYVVAASTENRQ
jgi:ABC-type transporter Mla subunit MlaD